MVLTIRKLLLNLIVKELKNHCNMLKCGVLYADGQWDLRETEYAANNWSKVLTLQIDNSRRPQKFGFNMYSAKSGNSWESGTLWVEYVYFQK